MKTIHSKITYILFLSAYLLTWFLFSSEKTIKSHTDEFLYYLTKQNNEILPRDNKEDSTIYLINVNNFGFNNNFDNYSPYDQKIKYISGRYFHIQDCEEDSKSGYPLVMTTEAKLYTPFFSSISYNYHFYGTDLYSEIIVFSSWFFFTWLETPLVRNNTASWIFIYILRFLFVILIPIAWLMLGYFVFKRK